MISTISTGEVYRVIQTTRATNLLQQHLTGRKNLIAKAYLNYFFIKSRMFKASLPVKNWHTYRYIHI